MPQSLNFNAPLAQAALTPRRRQLQTYVLMRRGEEVARGSAETCWNALRERAGDRPIHHLFEAGWAIDTAPAHAA